MTFHPVNYDLSPRYNIKFQQLTSAKNYTNYTKLNNVKLPLLFFVLKYFVI